MYGRRDKPEINPVAHCSLKECSDLLVARNLNGRLENRLLRQKIDQYICRYFGGQRNEGLDKQQLELLLQGLPNVISLPTPEPKPVLASRPGTPHPVRRMLSEDKLETHEIVIEPTEVEAQPEGWKKISEERTSLPAAKITEIKEFTPVAWAKAKAKEKMVAQAA